MLSPAIKDIYIGYHKENWRLGNDKLSDMDALIFHKGDYWMSPNSFMFYACDSYNIHLVIYLKWCGK